MDETSVNILDKMDVFVKIILPILLVVLGWALGHFFTALIPYKRKIVVDLDLEHMQFKAYNTGNAAIVIKTIGLSRRWFWGKAHKKILYQQPVDAALQPGTDPRLIDIPEEKFILNIESSLGEKKYPRKFNCFLYDPNGRYYKTKCVSDLWTHHEHYWGRDPNAANENNIPY